MFGLSTLVVLGALLAAVPAGVEAAPSDAGDAGYTFNESRGCGNDVAGPATPIVSRTGLQLPTEILYGPWADFFGRSRGQIEASLVDWEVPMSGGRTVRVHQRLVPALERVTAGLAAAASIGLDYNVRHLSAWTFRTIGGAERASQHLFGNAVDINPPSNPLREDGTLITNIPQWFVDAWTAAGFCWGGDWVEKKDPMHFSWMGPLATGGYGPRPAPYPPLNARASFSQVALVAATPFAGSGAYSASDRSGDGSEDLYFVRARGRFLRVEVAGSRSDFGIVGRRRDTTIAADPGDLLFGDFDHDGRADIWVLDRSSATLSVYSDSTSFRDAVGLFTLPVPVDSATDLFLGHFDSDFDPDLFVVQRGRANTTISVYSAASRFRTAIAAGTASLGDTTDRTQWSFVVGDRDVDGVDDVYAVHAGAPVTVTVFLGAASFSPDPTLSTGLTMPPGTTVLNGDYDGDGRDDLYVVGDRYVAVYLGGERWVGEDLRSWFLPDDPWPWDAGPECTGGKPCDQIGLVDSRGEWSLRDAVASDVGDVDFLFGNPGDVAFTGDWDCNGTATPGLYRRSDGYVYLRNSNTTGAGDLRFFFGNPGDLPLAGDFDGDGCDTVSLYRPAEGRFYIINRLGNGDAGLGFAETSYLFGDPGDKPFIGDFDGNGIDDVGLHRETTGLVYFRLSHSQGVADAFFIFGNPGDVLVAGDWDGDGIDTPAVYRPSNGNWYVKLRNAEGVADHAVHYSDDGSVQPVAGRFGTKS